MSRLQIFRWLLPCPCEGKRSLSRPGSTDSSHHHPLTSMKLATTIILCYPLKHFFSFFNQIYIHFNFKMPTFHSLFTNSTISRFLQRNLGQHIPPHIIINDPTINTYHSSTLCYRPQDIPCSPAFNSSITTPTNTPAFPLSSPRNQPSSQLHAARYRQARHAYPHTTPANIGSYGVTILYACHSSFIPPTFL